MNKELYMEAEPTMEELIEMEELEEEIEAEQDTDDYYSEDSVQMYMHEISKIPRLTAEEELELGKIVAEGGPAAKEARDKLITSNLKLVIYHAKRFKGRGVDLADLNSMGNEGLFKAVEKFDYTRGYKFSTYASWWIVQAIRRGIACEADTVRIPVHMTETVNKVRRAQKELLQKYMEEPSVEEIAEHLHLPESKVMAAFEAMYSIVSFEKKIGEDSDTTLEDMLEDENAVDPAKVVEFTALQKSLKKVLKKLEPKEAMVLKCRYGLDLPAPMTLEEIAKLPGFDVTRERIRQIEERALRKIKQSPSSMHELEDYIRAS